MDMPAWLHPPLTGLPDHNLSIYNRGISGNKYPLDARWQSDCIDHKPDILSILIGVNDIWHDSGKYDGTMQRYEDDYMSLLDEPVKLFPMCNLLSVNPSC